MNSYLCVIELIEGVVSLVMVFNHHQIKEAETLFQKLVQENFDESELEEFRKDATHVFKDDCSYEVMIRESDY